MTRRIWDETPHPQEHFLSHCSPNTNHQIRNVDSATQTLVCSASRGEAVSLSREVVETKKKRTSTSSRTSLCLIHGVASDLRQTGIRRNETVLDGGDDRFQSHRWPQHHLRSCPLSRPPSLPDRSRFSGMAQTLTDRRFQCTRQIRPSLTVKQTAQCPLSSLILGFYQK